MILRDPLLDPPNRRVTKLRVLVVYAHPWPTSFIAALRSKVIEALRSGGHEVDDLDLYAEKFDPVLSPQMFRDYIDVNANTREVDAYVRRLRAAEALVLVYPVWFDGLPAILEGYFQRVFLPGVAMVIDEKGQFHPNLQNLKRIAAICAYGEVRREVESKGDPPRRLVRDNIAVLMDPKGAVRILRTLRHELPTSAPTRRFSPTSGARLRRMTRGVRMSAHGKARRLSTPAATVDDTQDPNCPRIHVLFVALSSSRAYTTEFATVGGSASELRRYGRRRRRRRGRNRQRQPYVVAGWSMHGRRIRHSL